MDKDSKRLLWNRIQSQHKDLAKALVEARGNGRRNVRIANYPAATEQWIDQALARHKPELKRMIEEELKPFIEVFEDPDAVIEVEIDDLIEALIAAEGLGDKPKPGKRRAA